MGNGCPPAYYGSQAGQVASRRKRYYVEFDGDSSDIDCGADASLEDLALGTFTVDFWLALNSFGASQVVVDKLSAIGLDGWEIWIDATNHIMANVPWDFLPTQSRTNQTITDGAWRHITVAFNMGVNDLIYIAINGQWCTYLVQDAGIFVGPVSDAGHDLHMGNTLGAEWLNGSLSWLRLSSGIRYPIGVAFTPPARCIPPAVDASTIELWEMDEGAGVVTAASVVAANQGAMTGCAWHKCK